MELTLKNLGPINEANFTVGDLTVICGKNNTGKTYVTYATYGFLDYWNAGWPEVSFPAGFDNINPLETYPRRLLHAACLDYSKNWISKIFPDKDLLKNSIFSLDDDINETPSCKSKNPKALPKAFIEIKRTNAPAVDIVNQLKGALCAFEYCQIIAHEFFQESHFLEHYQKRFISLRHIGGTKQKTEIERTATLGAKHNTPNYPLKISWAKTIQFKKIAA